MNKNRKKIDLEVSPAAEHALTEKCEELKREHKRLKRVAMVCETRMEDGDTQSSLTY